MSKNRTQLFRYGRGHCSNLICHLERKQSHSSAAGFISVSTEVAKFMFQWKKQWECMNRLSNYSVVYLIISCPALNVKTHHICIHRSYILCVKRYRHRALQTYAEL